MLSMCIFFKFIACLWLLLWLLFLLMFLSNYSSPHWVVVKGNTLNRPKHTDNHTTHSYIHTCGQLKVSCLSSHCRKSELTHEHHRNVTEKSQTISPLAIHHFSWKFTLMTNTCGFTSLGWVIICCTWLFFLLASCGIMKLNNAQQMLN